MPGPSHRVFEGHLGAIPFIFTHEEFQQLTLDPPYSDNYRSTYTWSLVNNKKAYLSCFFRGPIHCDWALCVVVNDDLDHDDGEL